MALDSVDAIAAGMLPPFPFFKVGATMEAAGVRHSFAYASGTPGAMAAPSSGMAGAAITNRAGLIVVPTPTAPALSILSGFDGNATIAGQIVLIDRLWDNSGIVVTTTTAQTINSVAFPARDRNGATAGEDVQFALEVSAATTNAGAVTNTTAVYTNSNSIGSKTATIGSFPATSAAGTFVPFQLAAGDKGVQSIQSVTLGTSYVTGTVHLVAYREIARLSIPTANIGKELDALGTKMARLYDGTNLQHLFIPSATTACNLSGAIYISQG